MAVKARRRVVHLARVYPAAAWRVRVGAQPRRPRARGGAQQRARVVAARETVRGNSFTADEEALVERIAIAATATVASAPGGAERNAAAAAALVEADAVFTFLAGDDNALNDELNADVVDALCVAVHAASVSVLADIDEVAATVLVDDGWLDAAFTVADEYATRSNDSTRRRVFSRHGFVGAATYCARFRDLSADDRSKFLSLRASNSRRRREANSRKKFPLERPHLPAVKCPRHCPQKRKTARCSGLT